MSNMHRFILQRALPALLVCVTCAQDVRSEAMAEPADRSLGVVDSLLVALGLKKGELTGTRPHDLFAQDAGLLALAQAIERDDAVGIRQAIDRGASVNGRGRGGITPLLYAMSQQKIAAMKALVAAGADPLADAPGLMESPLGTAAASSNPALLRALLDAGCDPATVSERAAPLLILAIDAGRLDNVRLLIEAGADIDTSDAAGNSALVEAFLNMEYDLLYWLLERGADPRRSRWNVAAMLTDKLGRVKPGSESEMRIRSLIDLLQARGFTAATPVHWDAPDWVLWEDEMVKRHGDKWSFPGWVRGKPHVPVQR